MVCGTPTILRVPTTTPRGAKSISCRALVVNISLMVLAPKLKPAQHGLRYSNNSPTGHNNAAWCQVDHLSSLRGEDFSGGFGPETETCPAWSAVLQQFS